MRNKAYRVDLLSEPINDDKKDFYHIGIYSFENLFYRVPLNLDSTKELLNIEGHICEVFFTCSIINFLPLTVIFEPVFIDPIIKNTHLEYFKTKELAFKNTIANLKSLINLKLKEQPLDSEGMPAILNTYTDQYIQKYSNKIKQINPPCSGNKIVNKYSNISVIYPFTV